jgi:hypothetical protein
MAERSVFVQVVTIGQGFKIGRSTVIWGPAAQPAIPLGFLAPLDTICVVLWSCPSSILAHFSASIAHSFVASSLL